MEIDLHVRLQQLAETLVVPREDDGTAAVLTALMPCEPAVGEVAVACWRDSADGELVELVRLDDGTRIDDQVALREALTLLAMVETVEELASFGLLEDVATQLRGWAPASGADASALAPARERACAALEALAALEPDTVRMARTQRLDELGAALRGLEQAWDSLEQAAAAWSDAQLDATAGDDATRASVQQLWQLLGLCRRGPLARPVSTALHEGREAGAAMAAAVSTS